jgi:hypothetical protein
LSVGLVSAPPDRPGDDVGGLDAPLRKPLCYSADFLCRPADEIGRLLVATGLVFLGGGLFV